MAISVITKTINISKIPINTINGYLIDIYGDIIRWAITSVNDIGYEVTLTYIKTPV